MIRFSVLYPVTPDASFDHDYYRGPHLDLMVSTWSPLSAEIDKSVDGPYTAAVHLTFESMESMGAAMSAAGTADVMADVANYTSIQPVLQISEIVVTK